MPPDPAPATSTSTFPSNASYISFPVFLFASIFAGLSNCLAINEFGISFKSFSAFSTAPSMPLSDGVIISSAPKAFISICFSIENFSGITMISLYPFSKAASARPIPVFPAVASIMVEPGFKSPSFSAVSIISMPILSLILPPGFKYSSFAKIFISLFGVILFNFNSGVFPIISRISFI